MNSENDLTGSVYAYIVTAPDPTLTVTGHVGVITDVRFRWNGLYCCYCRKAVTLWADGGSIEAGIRIGERRRRTDVAEHWYTEYRVPNAPVIPATCPHRGCQRPPVRASETGAPTPAGWLDGRWNLKTGTFSTADAPCQPVQPKTCHLLNDIWQHVRTHHPGLAAAADRHAKDKQWRRERHTRRT